MHDNLAGGQLQSPAQAVGHPAQRGFVPPGQQTNFLACNRMNLQFNHRTVADFHATCISRDGRQLASMPFQPFCPEEALCFHT